MIYLTKGQTLFENPGMVVYSSTGYYNDGDVVICAMAYAPEEPACGYEAKYIAYGTMVYGISDEEKLIEEVIKIDPETLLGKTNKEFVIDNLVQEIKTVENPTPELTQDAVEINNTNVENEDTTVETIIETDENGDVTTTTTTTTITEETIPDDTGAVIEVPVIEPPIVTPDLPVIDIEVPVITPEIPIIPDEAVATPVVDQVVSKLKRIKKIV